ncbi:hypothetical protein ALC53_00593 [Atta colombica]|uniref:Uncharacterized protein n=1 Tax=Atta colombica TaxID=520822 RepID=A0A195BWP3_9HYME|nr:hypothetical protein ALC53_00593 [Atta colombica]
MSLSPIRRRLACRSINHTSHPNYILRGVIILSRVDSFFNEMRKIGTGPNSSIVRRRASHSAIRNYSQKGGEAIQTDYFTHCQSSFVYHLDSHRVTISRNKRNFCISHFLRNIFCFFFYFRINLVLFSKYI